MNSSDNTSDPAKQALQDFDFTRWNLKELNLDSSSASLSGLAEKLFASPEWRQHFTATLPAMKDAVQKYFEKRSGLLKTGVANQESELKKRLSEATSQNDTFQTLLRAASAPPGMKADPNSFQLGVRVIDEKSSLGLPGLRVKMLDEREKDKVLAEGGTDVDGNAVLSLSKEQAAELARGKIEPSVQVQTPEGKTVHLAAQAVCPRPDHTQTLIASLSDSSQVQPQLAAAEELKAEREARALELQAKGDRLKMYYEGRQKQLKAQLEETQQILDELHKEATAPEDDPGPFGGSRSRAKRHPAADKPPVSSGTGKPAGHEAAPTAPPHPPGTSKYSSPAKKPADTEQRAAHVKRKVAASSHKAKGPAKRKPRHK